MKRVYFIFNLHSGKAALNNQIPKLLDQFTAAGYEVTVHPTQRQGDGIVSAKYSDTKVEGMGYAIPISTAKNIIETIINQEVVSDDEASYFGISGVDVASDVSKQYDMPTGVYVTKVAANSAASKAGIQKGDIIVSFNGREVSSMDEISNVMQYLKAGTKVDVVVAQASNNYEEKTMEVTLTKKK